MNNCIQLKHDKLHMEGVALDVLAEQYGSPLFVYSQTAFTHQWQAYKQAFGTRSHDICYAVKANSNLSILQQFAKLGSGFDVVSGGELKAVLLAGGIASKTIFSGVAKQPWEISLALEAGVNSFSVESAAELDRIASIAQKMGAIAPISIRVNPDVDANTHPYIATGLKDNKFGVTIDEAQRLYLQAHTDPCLKVKGISCHIGSQLLDIQPFQDAVQKVLQVVDQLKEVGVELSHIDLGGGLGVQYAQESPPTINDYLSQILALIPEDYTVIIEPGRSVIANAGVLITKVEYLKHNGGKHFAIVDAAMNDLIRPALYSAHHEIEPVVKRAGSKTVYDIVGPVCESSDFLGKNRDLIIQANDYLCVHSVGAYSRVMASNYNTRPFVAEVLVHESNHRLIRARQSFESLFAPEQACLESP